MKTSTAESKRMLMRKLKRNIKQYTPRIILLYRNYMKRIGRLPDLKNPKRFSR